MAVSASRPALEGAALRTAIREVSARHLDLTRHDVFLFGSEAAGAARPRHSDIDVGIRGPAAVPLATLQRIRYDLEALRTLRMFDVVDFAVVDDAFRHEALRHVERL